MDNKSEREVTTPARKKERKLAMVPLFSWRSIIALAIGFIVGAAMGLGYWVISPSLAAPSNEPSTEVETGGFLESIRPSPPSSSWESTVSVQIVNPGSAYIVLRQLQSIAESYAAKANSLPFLQFLSEELTKQAPEYYHTPDELDKLISIRYDSRSEQPSIEIKATTPTIQETAFLTSIIPETFQSYLINEESLKKQQEYQNTLKSIEDVKKSLLEASEELSTLGPPGAASDIQNDPNYVALSAKIEALKRELERQAAKLSTSIAEGNKSMDSVTLQLEYQKTLQEARKTNDALIKAEEDLHSLETQNASDIQNEPDYIALSAKIEALQTELDRQMTGYTIISEGGAPTRVIGLAEMIANGTTTGLTYENMLKKVETTSAALSEAKKRLASLESQTSNDSTLNSLDYQLAKINVDILKEKMDTINEKLTTLASESIEGESLQDVQATFERTSAALSDARTQLAILESRASNNSTAVNIEYQLAQAKVKSLKDTLTNLNNNLSSSLVGGTDVSATIDYLSVGKPSVPEPVLTESMRGRSALMLGAIIGVVLAWIVLNFRWLVKGVSSPAEKEEEV